MSALERLPPPALERILSYLGYHVLCNLGSTCTNLNQALKELTTRVLSVARPEEMCVQSNRLILGLNLVLDTNEEMLKAMLRSFPKLESLVMSHKYKAGRLKFSVTPTEAKTIDPNDEERCSRGKMAKNMLSPWGHHLLGHHYLDMLLALHTRLSLHLSHLDLQVNEFFLKTTRFSVALQTNLYRVIQVDLLCESCQQFLSRLDQAEYLASSVHLNLRLVSLCFPERSPSSQNYLEFLATLRKVKNLTQLKLTDICPQYASLLSQLSNTSEKLDSFHLIIN